MLFSRIYQSKKALLPVVDAVTFNTTTAQLTQSMTIFRRHVPNLVPLPVSRMWSRFPCVYLVLVCQLINLQIFLPQSPEFRCFEVERSVIGKIVRVESTLRKKIATVHFTTIPCGPNKHSQ